MEDKPYSLNIAPQAIPDAELPGLYRSLRSTWVLHMKLDHWVAADSLKPIVETLRTELQSRKIKRVA